MKTVTFVITLLIINPIFGQNLSSYKEQVKEARSLYKAKEYIKSAQKYKEAFDKLDGKAYPNDRYNAACSYALSKDVYNSFYHLFYLANNPKIKYRNIDHISTDPDLEVLHSEDKWSRLIQIVKSNKYEYEKDFDKNIVAQLDTIFKMDQRSRLKMEKIEEMYGRKSDEMQAHLEEIAKIDSLNLTKVTKTLDERGWLGPKVIGDQGSNTLFLVIQHSDLETQLLYLPMMREAVKLGNAKASNLALLEDRVAVRQGERQIYGSQIGRDPDTEELYVYPLIKPEEVNERRAKVGLGTIEDYISHWNMVWDLKEHKKRTAKIDSQKER